MSAITPLVFDETIVRVATLEGEPWFVGRDVAGVLGYADPTNAMKQHCRGVVKRHPILDSLGRTQEVRILSEPDVLRLIVSSRLPAAERFERWVFEEVLPSLRKYGHYGRPCTEACHSIMLQQQLLHTQQKLIAAQEKLLAMHTATQTGGMAEHPAVATFWAHFARLNADGRLNHARQPGVIAINLPEVQATFYRNGLDWPAQPTAMRALLRTSLQPRYLTANHPTRCPGSRRTLRCWIFQDNHPQAALPLAIGVA